MPEAPAVLQAVYTAGGKYAHAAMAKTAYVPGVKSRKAQRLTWWRTYCGNLGAEPKPDDPRPYSWAEVEPKDRCRKCVAAQEHRAGNGS